MTSLFHFLRQQQMLWYSHEAQLRQYIACLFLFYVTARFCVSRAARNLQRCLCFQPSRCVRLCFFISLLRWYRFGRYCAGFSVCFGQHIAYLSFDGQLVPISLLFNHHTSSISLVLPKYCAGFCGFPRHFCS